MSHDTVDPQSLPEHVRLNREAWAGYAPSYVEPGRRAWAGEPHWGIWHIPEADLHLLPDDLDGVDAIELGCGTGYVSAWLARRGARPVGIDNSPEQIATARGFQREFGIDFPILLGNAETVPYPDASFDLAITEYGASLWADPYRWVPEAARLLRPRGRLVFVTNGPLLQLTVPDLEADGPAGTQLLRPYFGMYRTTWPDDPSVEFHLPHGEWIRLLRENGFEVERLVEMRPAESASADTRWTYVTLDWARKWPAEEAWVARKGG